MLRKAITTVKNRLGANRLFTDQEVVDLVKENKILLKHASTPAPSVESPEMLDEADIRLPRIPFNQTLFYFMRWQSVILRMICLKLKQEIFRETMKEGFDWEPAFKAKCLACGKELRESTKQCIHCQSTNLVAPDPSQKILWDKWILSVNKADQTFLEICSELEDDLNTVDDLYLICIKEYLLSPDQQELTGRLKEVMRGDPTRFRIVADETGRRGGKYWVCPTHREQFQAMPGKCGYEDLDTREVCTLPLYDVHYVETQGGGKNPLKFYIKGEVIHTSKYEPSRLYGISPIFTLWIISRTLMLMDRYAENLYEKGRLKGILGVSTENRAELKKWWDETQQRLRQDPHYMPVVAVEGGDKGKGRIEFVKLMNSLQEMQSSEYRRELRLNIASTYGISPIFQADLSTGGGLQNEGLQITVTDRAVDMGQSIYHNAVFPKVAAMLGITDWKPKLKPSREMDEMAELQRMELKVRTAKEMIDLGFEAKFEDEQFIFTGEAKRKEELTGQLPSSAASPKLLPARTREGQPEPDNRQGIKNCPPGMQATPENPRCHPIDWDATKQKAIPNDGIHRLSKADIASQINALKKEMRQTEMKVHLAAARYGAGSKEEKLFEQQLKDQRYLLVQLQNELDKAALSTAVNAYFNPKYEKERMPRKFIANIDSNGRGLENYNRLSRHGKRELKTDLWQSYGDSWFNLPAGKQKQLIGFVAKDLLKAEITKGAGPDPSPGSINAGKRLKIFDMERQDDESGISGTGLVASGIVFPDGKVVLRWNTETASTTEFDSYEDFLKIHVKSHPDNKTKIHFYNLTEGEVKEIKKSGDMLAHYACIGNKLRKAGIIPAAKRGKAFKDWWDKEKQTNPKAKTINEACDKAGNIGESDPDYPDPPGYNKAAVESGRAVDQETQKIENHFVRAMDKGLTSDLVSKIKEIVGKGIPSKLLLMKLVTDLLSKATPKMEKLAFAEILRAYQEGKAMVSEEGKLEKMAPPFSTSGGKARMARRLKTIIPAHQTYNEPFVGAGSIFLKKELATANYLNDRDPEVMKIWRVLQKGEDFEWLRARDWNRSESTFNKLKKQNPEELSDKERAYRKIYLRKFSAQSQETRLLRANNKGMPFWLRNEEAFHKYSEQLKKAKLFNKDWKEITLKTDSPSTFHFIDPPYEEAFAKELCEVLPKLKGKYLVTFSENETLQKKFGKTVHPIKVRSQSNFPRGDKTKNEDNIRTEFLLTNYPISVGRDTLFKAEDGLFKTEDAPRFAISEILDFSKGDQQVLRAIFEENPFWKSFANMSKSTSEKLQEIITESYEPANSSRMKATVRDVLAEAKKKGKPITKTHAEVIAYGRIGKFDLAKTIEMMKRTLQTEVYRLERIARTETTGITAKGREIAMVERDEQNVFRYDWFGPVDHRTSDICKEIGKRVTAEGQGQGVPLPELKDIMKSVTDELNPKWGYRDWVPHANCRRVLRRVS